MMLATPALALLVAVAMAHAAAPPGPGPGNWTPNWPANWNLTQSTVIEPSSAGYFLPAHTYGLVSLDWATGKDIWSARGKALSNQTAMSVDNCRVLKAAGKATRCFIYHNLELALEWEEDQRAAMVDPSKAHYFLQYTDGHGATNGTIYNEPVVITTNTSRLPWDQYFWNHTNPEASAYFVDAVMRSVTSPGGAVDGVFTDDVYGVPMEHVHAARNIKMSAAELADLQGATAATHAELVRQLVASGKFNWQAFPSEPKDDDPATGISKKSCTAFMREHCRPEMQSQPLLMSAGSPGSHKDHGPCFGSGACPQSVAAFLIVRPPVAFIGYGWESDDNDWHDIFLLQPGVPTGLCKEQGTSGVFTRAWTNGVAELDCKKWQAHLPFPAMQW